MPGFSLPGISGSLANSSHKSVPEKSTEKRLPQTLTNSSQAQSPPKLEFTFSTPIQKSNSVSKNTALPAKEVCKLNMT